MLFGRTAASSFTVVSAVRITAVPTQEPAPSNSPYLAGRHWFAVRDVHSRHGLRAHPHVCHSWPGPDSGGSTATLTGIAFSAMVPSGAVGTVMTQGQATV